MTLFDQIKERYASQFPREQFAVVFGSTTAEEAGDVLTIHPGNPIARAWLEQRMAAALARTVNQIAGRPIEIRYSANGHTPATKPAEPRPAPEFVSVPSTYDPRKRLWSKHELIVSTFYPAYFVARAGRVIGSTCVPFWRHLVDKFDMSKNDQLDWTPRATYSVGPLAEALGWPVTYLSGRLRTCHIFDQALAETGECIDCCRHFAGARPGQTQGGRPCCHYRVAGAIEVLAGEGWIVARKIGADSRDTRYEIQALRYPPFLTPDQLAWLPAKLQDSHAEFLRTNGLDAAEWQAGGLSVVGLAGLELSESSFLMPIGIKTLAGVKVLMPIGTKSFFLPTNYCQQAEKPGQVVADRSPPAVRKRLNGDIDIDSDLKYTY